MVNVVHVFVEGVPVKKRKTRGNLQTPARWTSAVREQTSSSDKAEGSCQLDVEFILPMNSFPEDHSYGPDLDNLLKSSLDALKNTILSEVKGHDGGIVDLRARKRTAKDREPTGARMIFARTSL